MEMTGEDYEDLHSRIFRGLVDVELQRRGGRQLNSVEQMYCLVSHFDSEVRNGGLAQFFTNPYGTELKRVMAGLREIGANEVLEILEEFLANIPREVDLTNQCEMGRYLFGEGLPAERLEYLNDRYYSYSDSFFRKMIDYARKHHIWTE